MKLARLKVRCFFVFSFTPSIPSLPIVHSFDHNLKKVSFEAWCIQGLVMIVLWCCSSYILTCIVHAIWKCSYSDNYNLFSMNCQSHKKMIIRRKTEYLNVIMIETDFHPWLKVVLIWKKQNINNLNFTRLINRF